MKKKEYLQEVLDLYAELKNSTKVAIAMCKKYELTYTESLGRKIRSWVYSSKEEIKLDESDMYKIASERTVNKSKYRIITSAQNATAVHTKFFKSLKNYAEVLNAEINIIPIRYKNPTSTFQESEHDYWSKELQEYLVASRNYIHNNLLLLADIKMQPTAVMPLTGLEGLSGTESCILAHPRQHFKVCPTLDGQPAKFLATTGCVTMKNYTDSKAGKKGEFHHTYGFIIVEEMDDDTFAIRQVSATDDGKFCDLDYKVSPNGVEQTNDIVDIVTLGDIHLGDECVESMRWSNLMLERFQPNHVIFHDIMDGSSVSHHERKNPFIALERERDGSNNLEVELEKVVDFLGYYLKWNPVVVKSNHDIFVDRWLEDIDWRKEGNKYSYLKYGKLKADGELPNGILPYELNKAYGNKVVCLTENDSFKINKTEFGVHGHIGAGGSRGSATQYKKMNTKLVTAHTHSPLKIDNLTTVGTNTILRMGYNKGMSAWYSANAITHYNGKTQLILINGKKGYTTL